jgi:TonB family protein
MSYLLRLITFILAMAIGVLGSYVYLNAPPSPHEYEDALVSRVVVPENSMSACSGRYNLSINSAGGSGSSGSGYGSSNHKVDVEGLPTINRSLKVLSKKKPEYTPEARSQNIEGTVMLRVTFLASGGIGAVTTVKGLPCGLTERAIEAARQIRFEPETINGTRRTTTRPVSYSFNIY